MKKLETKKPLSLSTHTVRPLTERQLETIVGGQRSGPSTAPNPSGG